MKGRRLPDTKYGLLAQGFEPGDFWRVLDEDGSPLRSPDPQNLTGEIWYVVAPFGSLALLTHHTVREEEDGSISVRPGDGSSNSILITGANGQTYHGYIERGEWTP